MQEKDVNKAKGGYARAEVLTPDQRKEIAKKAALSRWDVGVPQVEFEGPFNIGNKTLFGAVLPNGKRVLTQGTFLITLGRSRTPKAGTGVLSTVDGIPPFLQAEVLKPFISDELLESTTPIFFRTKSGKKMVGYDAQLLPAVAEVYLKMRDKLLSEGRPIPRQYSHIITACDIVIRGLARIGIIALVDEATGYQEVRDRLALQKILDKYLTDEWSKWTKTFPDDYYRELFRLKGLPYPPNSSKRPSYIGHWTNDIVYSRLAPGVLRDLKKLNPRSPSGNRKRKFFQFLTQDWGTPALREHLSNTVFLMKTCSSWEDFRKRLNKASPKYGNTIPLDFPE